MSRTKRKHKYFIKKYARRDVENTTFDSNCDMNRRRTLAILRGDDGRISYDKCSNAKIDDEGSWKLDTWSECSHKHTPVHRRRRSADKILIKKQLEDI